MKKDTDRLTPGAVLILLTPIILIYFFSNTPSYVYHKENVAALLVSFKEVTDRVHLCDEEELKEFKAAAKKRRKHMQRANRVCGSRERVPLGLKVWVDDKVMLDRKLVPSGIRKDSATYVYEKFLLPLGEHKVKIAMRDSKKGDDEFDYFYENTINFEKHDRVVIDFDMIQEKFFKA